MNMMTAIGAAFRRAGYDTGSQRLYAEATKALNGNTKAPWAAIDPFQQAIENDPEILAALVKWDRPAFEKMCLDFLRFAAGDMSGGEAVAAGRGAPDAPRRPAGGQTPSDGAEPSSEVRAGGGRTPHDDRPHGAPARANSPSLAKAPRGAKAISAVQGVMKTALDSFTIRDGRAIGDVRIVEIPLLAEQNEREAFVFLEIKKRVDAFAKDVDIEWKIRDFIKPDDLKGIIDEYTNIRKAVKGGARGEAS